MVVKNLPYHYNENTIRYQNYNPKNYHKVEKNSPIFSKEANSNIEPLQVTLKAKTSNASTMVKGTKGKRHSDENTRTAYGDDT